MKPVKQLQETAIFTYKDYLHPYKRENALHHLSPHKVQQQGTLGAGLALE